jgi:5-methylcytosine-specific restriction endonuclease McrA
VTDSMCASCGGVIVRRKRGRRRKFCETCRPSTFSAMRPNGTCAECAKPIHLRSGSLGQGKTRCQKCRTGPAGAAEQLARRRQLDRAAARRYREKFGPTNHHGRARRYGVEYERIDKRRVFARDKWQCGLCGARVDRRLAWPHPLSATLDHIVPMSCGGPHTYANVQLAHLSCNSAKSNRGGGEQLALVG